jgi:hypothetical protein
MTTESNMTKQLALRVTAEEYDLVHLAAATARRKPSDWLRLTIVDAIAAAGIALPPDPAATPAKTPRAAAKTASKPARGAGKGKTASKPVKGSGKRQLRIDGGSDPA